MPHADKDPLDTLAFSLMRDLVTITSERWVAPARFTGIADDWGVHEAAARVRLLTGILKILRTLPVPVFPDLEVREAILQSAQQALDQAIETEQNPT